MDAAVDEQYLEELISRRKQLFDKFLKNPKNTHSALEIKALDDEICELRLRRQMPVQASAS